MRLNELITFVVGALALSNPITGIAGCCARASGNANAMPLIEAMNFRLTLIAIGPSGGVTRTGMPGTMPRLDKMVCDVLHERRTECLLMALSDDIDWVAAACPLWAAQSGRQQT